MVLFNNSLVGLFSMERETFNCSVIGLDHVAVMRCNDFLDFNFVGIEGKGYQAFVVEIRCQQLNDNSEKINSIPDGIQDQVKIPTYFQFETKLICCQRRL